MNIAIVLSGGNGSRIGAELPKQYIDVRGRMIISYCLETIIKHNKIDAVCIVANEIYHRRITDEIKKLGMEVKYAHDSTIGSVSFGSGLVKHLIYALPGVNRQLSIYNGMNAVKKYASDDSTVFIHDAARPCLSHSMISSCYEALKDHDGVLPVLPMKDTVYRSKDGKKIDSLLAREEIYAGQAPELFLYDKYLQANSCLLPDAILKINGSTEPAIMAGMDIVMIPGEEGNYKITTPADLQKFIGE